MTPTYLNTVTAKVQICRDLCCVVSYSTPRTWITWGKSTPPVYSEFLVFSVCSLQLTFRKVSACAC